MPRAKKAASAAAPRKRGRPKGSKNKPKVVDATAAAPRKRGRPKGSASKAKVAAAVAVVRRGPGRPKGSVTKRRRRRVGARRGRPVVAAALSRRLDTLIKQLEALRDEIGSLEHVRTLISNLPKM